MTSIICDSLLCSSCTKYLSIFPIKIYHNLAVKCGRCNSQDDGGIVSQLYELLAESLLFPCVNRYEGCTELLYPKEMKLHESKCVGASFQCPINCMFKGGSFAMVRHFKQQHPSRLLDCSEFLIVFDDKNEDTFYLYASAAEHMLAVVYVRYDNATKYFYLDIAPIYPGHVEEEKNYLQNFELFTVFRQKMYTSLQRNCAIYKESSSSVESDNRGMCIQSDYPRNVGICKFFIQNEFGFMRPSGTHPKPTVPSTPQHESKQKIPIPINVSTKLTFFIDNIGQVNEHTFSLANTTWKFSAKKTYRLFSQQLVCVIEKIKPDHCSYEISAHIIALSFPAEKPGSPFFRKILGSRTNEDRSFQKSLAWPIQLGENLGFIEINMTVLKILPHESGCACSECFFRSVLTS